MPCCEISDRAQMSKTIIAVRHFALGGRESLDNNVKRFRYYFSSKLAGLFAHNCRDQILYSALYTLCRRFTVVPIEVFLEY